MSKIFVDSKSYLNLELGAGCGNFGALYHSTCYLTDIDESLGQVCPNCSIDIFCDAYNLPWSENRFHKVILCNPYGFGFNDEDNSSLLLKEIVRVCRNGSQIIIIGNKINRFCAPARVAKRINKFTKDFKNVSLNFHEEDLDCATDYHGYNFFTVSGDKAIPNKRITIDVVK